MAYLTEPEISKILGSSQYQLSYYGTASKHQVAFFIVTNEAKKTQSIAVRGTSNIENALINASLKLILDEKTGLKFHDGFSLVSRQIYTALKPHLKSDYSIHTTGHSLGGAVALILAAYLHSDKFSVATVTTFGQPKVTNFEGANSLNHLDIKRIVLPNDLVPLIPPFDPLDIQNLDIYWHAGKELILLKDTQYTIVEGVDAMLRATKFTQEPLNEGNLVNHKMSIYRQAVNKKTPLAKQVAYENNFNLFNLFGGDTPEPATSQ